MASVGGSQSAVAALGCLAVACASSPRSSAPPTPTTAAAAAVTAAAGSFAPNSCDAQQARKLLPPDRAEAFARTTALAIRDAVAREDFAALATFVNGRLCLQAQKGGSCRWMSQAELRTCGTRTTREEWQVDTGADDYPRLTCLQAFRQTFFSNPGLASAPATFNCFQPREDNNATSVVNDEARGDIYVEFFADATVLREQWYPWQSLWLVLQSQGDAVQLIAIQSHYWGI